MANMRMNYFLIFLIVLSISFSSCSSESPYKNPEQISGNIVKSNIETVKTFVVGQTATDGKLAITLNDVKYVKVIESSTVFEEAPADRKYVIIDLSLENLLVDTTLSVNSPALFSTVQNMDGYSYDYDVSANYALDEQGKELKSSDLLPGGKRRGQIAFLVPEKEQDLSLQFKPGFLNIIITFELPNKPTEYSTEFKMKPDAKASINIEKVDWNYQRYELFFNSWGSGSINSIKVEVRNIGETSFKPSFDVIVSRNNVTLFEETQISVFKDRFKIQEEDTITLSLYKSIELPGNYIAKVVLKEEGSNKIIASVIQPFKVT